MASANEPETARMARLRAALESELGPDESVLWHGWQLGQIDLRMFGMYLFAVPWTAFSLAWTGIAAGAVASMGTEGPGVIAWAFPLWGLPFIAIGVWMLSRPFVPLWERGRVLYVVTERRVLKLSLGRTLEVNSVPADRIGPAQRREKADGTGVVQLAVRIGKDSDGDKQTEHFIIGAVDDVRGAQAALEAIARGPLAAPGGAGALSS